MKVRHFATAAAFRSWLERHHASATELFVGFYNKQSGRGGLTYAEALDEALCFGWIDGVRHKVDARSYTNRFTPRRHGSIWSHVNIAHVARLTAAGRMHAAGLAAAAARTPKRTGLYSFERQAARLSPAQTRTFRATPAAWKFFRAQAPSYQRTAIHWVTSAKQPATRERRLAKLIAAAHAARRLF